MPHVHTLEELDHALCAAGWPEEVVITPECYIHFYFVQRQYEDVQGCYFYAACGARVRPKNRAGYADFTEI